MGNVGASGEYELTRPDYRMLDAMVAAHGPTVSVGVDYCYVIRKVSSEKYLRRTRTNLPAKHPPRPPSPPRRPATCSLPRPGRNRRSILPFRSGPCSMDQTTTPSTTMVCSPPAPTKAPTASSKASPHPPPIKTTTPRLLKPAARGSRNSRTETPAPVTPPEQPEQPAVPPAPTGDSTGQFEFNAPKEPSDERVIRVPIWRLQHYGELKYNIVIRPGDMIVVPDPVTGVYYMGGHFLRSGVYSLTGIPVTIKEAWIAAGGGDDLAIPRRSEIIRQLGNDKEVFVRVDSPRSWAEKCPIFI